MDFIKKFLPLLSIILVIFVVLHLLYWQFALIWKVPQIPKVSVDLKVLFSLRLSSICSNVYAQCRRNYFHIARFFLFTRPALFVADPKLLKAIVNNNHHFRDRASYHNDPSDSTNLHLFNMKDDTWYCWRKIISKSFSLEQMKNYVKVFDVHANRCVNELSVAIKQNSDAVIDGFQLSNTFSYLVAMHIFLADTSTVESLPNLKIFEKLFNPGYRNKFVDVFGYVCPSILRCFRVCDIPKEVFQHLQQVGQNEIDNYQNANGNVKKESLLYQLLLDDKDNLMTNNKQILGILIGLFVGSLKSTTPFITYACYALAKAPHIQETVRQEILSTLSKRDGTLSVTDVQEMTFMQQVLNETLRLYNGGPLLIRECTEAFKLTFNSNVDTKRKDDIVNIDKGTLIFASLRDILNDSEYFPNPEVFDPTRFDDEHKNNLKMFWPFGFGKRFCIGNKFVILQAKVFLSCLLSKYELRLHQTSGRFNDKSIRIRDGFIYFNIQPLHNIVQA